MKPRTRSSSSRLKQSTLSFDTKNAQGLSSSPEKGKTRALTRSQNPFTLGRGSSPKCEIADDDAEVEEVETPHVKHHDYLEIGEAETSNDEKLQSSLVKKASASKTAKVASIFELSDDSEDDMPHSAKRRRDSRRAVIQENTSDDDDDDSEVHLPSSTPRKRRRKDVQQEEAELAEDLENLRDSPVESPAVKPESSSRQAALEVLKSRRGRAKAQTTPTRNHRNVILDSDDEDSDNAAPSSMAVRELDLEGAFEVSDGNEDEDKDEELGTTARDMFNENANDQDFLASSDSEDELGVPAELPFQFSSFARMKAKQAFEIVVEWMVQRKINPAFDRDAPKYVTAFQRVDDEAQGLVGSKFVSAAWTPAFTRSLRARPDINIWQEHHNDLQTCEACNRSGHPATYSIQLTGKPYDARTLEEIEQDSDEDEDEENVEETGDEDSAAERGEIYDANGALVEPASKIYAVGRFCMANARTAHTLHHWKFHLSGWVVEHLREKMKELTSAKIVQRDGWKVGKRRKDADRIVAEMGRDGTIKSLYKEYSQQIDLARNSKAGRSNLWS